MAAAPAPLPPVGSRVWLRDPSNDPSLPLRYGVCTFAGKIKDKDGYFVGVELDPVYPGKNDGSVGDVRYFTCAKDRGVFIRPDLVDAIVPLKDLDVAKTTIKGLTAEVADLTTQVSTLTDEQINLLETLSALETELAQCKRQAQIVSTAASDAASPARVAAATAAASTALVQQLHLLEETVGRLTKENAKLTSDNDELKADLDAALGPSADLEAVVSSKLLVEEKLEALRQQFDAAQQEIQEMKELLNLQDDELAAQKGETGDLESRVEFVTKELQTATANAASLHAAHRQRIAQLESEVLALRSQVTNRDDELAAASGATSEGQSFADARATIMDFLGAALRHSGTQLRRVVASIGSAVGRPRIANALSQFGASRTLQVWSSQLGMLTNAFDARLQRQLSTLAARQENWCENNASSQAEGGLATSRFVSKRGSVAVDHNMELYIETLDGTIVSALLHCVQFHVERAAFLIGHASSSGGGAAASSFDVSASPAAGQAIVAPAEAASPSPPVPTDTSPPRVGAAASSPPAVATKRSSWISPADIDVLESKLAALVTGVLDAGMGGSATDTALKAVSFVQSLRDRVDILEPRLGPQSRARSASVARPLDGSGGDIAAAPTAAVTATGGGPSYPVAVLRPLVQVIRAFAMTIMCSLDTASYTCTTHHAMTVLQDKVAGPICDCRRLLDVSADVLATLEPGGNSSPSSLVVEGSRATDLAAQLFAAAWQARSTASQFGDLNRDCLNSFLTDLANSPQLQLACSGLTAAHDVAMATASERAQMYECERSLFALSTASSRRARSVSVSGASPTADAATPSSTAGSASPTARMKPIAAMCKEGSASLQTLWVAWENQLARPVANLKDDDEDAAKTDIARSDDDVLNQLVVAIGAGNDNDDDDDGPMTHVIMSRTPASTAKGAGGGRNRTAIALEEATMELKLAAHREAQLKARVEVLEAECARIPLLSEALSLCQADLREQHHQLDVAASKTAELEAQYITAVNEITKEAKKLRQDVKQLDAALKESQNADMTVMSMAERRQFEAILRYHRLCALTWARDSLTPIVAARHGAVITTTQDRTSVAAATGTPPPSDGEDDLMLLAEEAAASTQPTHDVEMRPKTPPPLLPRQEGRLSTKMQLAHAGATSTLRTLLSTAKACRIDISWMKK